jgi:hypothetical protein
VESEQVAVLTEERDRWRRQVEKVDEALPEWEPSPDSTTGVVGRVQTIKNLKADRARVAVLEAGLRHAENGFLNIIGEMGVRLQPDPLAWADEVATVHVKAIRALLSTGEGTTADWHAINREQAERGLPPGLQDEDGRVLVPAVCPTCGSADPAKQLPHLYGNDDDVVHCRDAWHRGGTDQP